MGTATSAHRVDAAKHFVARGEELGRRMRDLRSKLDVSKYITARPLLAVGIAFGVGALLGLAGGRRTVVHEGAVARRAGSVIAGALGAFAIGLAKDFALRHVSTAAQSWFERAQSREPATATILDHS